MGSWNGTCGVSQLPILAGDKVKAILMLQSEFADVICGSGTCYTTDYFRPWFFPVTAEYNSYGSIENIQEDWNSKYMLETFQGWLKTEDVKILGEDAEINSPGIKSFKKLDDVFDCVERGALVAKNTGQHFDKTQNKWVPDGGYLKVGMFMVLDNIFTDLVKQTKQFILREDNDFYLKRNNEEYEKAIKHITSMRSPEIKTLSKKEFEFRGVLYDLYVDNVLGDLIGQHYQFKHYKTILYNPDYVSVDDFMNRLSDVKNFAEAMTILRKLWIPQTGQGSQSEELSFNKALIKSMSEHISKRDEEMEKNRLEEEEWNRQYEAEQDAKKKKKS